MYDVIIVGLGPAGGMTALTIAENSGLNVLAVDRKKKIGVSVSCAGGIVIKKGEGLLCPTNNRKQSV